MDVGSVGLSQVLANECSTESLQVKVHVSMLSGPLGPQCGTHVILVLFILVLLEHVTYKREINWHVGREIESSFDRCSAQTGLL